ncbi:hypothetical protein [Streptomyces luteireticuli]|uniref:Head-to-tail stopper n=1 Tax=Streptomyces luteireticuli TaxID=173858 RepID=A0ABN0YQV9_9ACTN
MIRFTDAIEVHAAPLVADAYTRSRDWSKSRLVWAGRGHVQPDRTFEARSPERDTSQERLLVYLPADVPVSAVDRVRYRGTWWEVDGEPMRWPHGALRHTRIRAWRVRN